MGEMINALLGLVLLVIGLGVLILPDPTSLTDVIALIIILASLSLLNVDTSKIIKNVKGVFK